MKRASIPTLIFSIVLLSSAVFAQQLFVANEIQQSYNAGMRTTDGAPGPNYWINHSEYKIDAELLPDSSKIVGHVDITYTNNSPDTLKMIVLRVYQNILSPGAVRDWPGSQPEVLPPVKLLNFTIADSVYEVGVRGSGASVNGTNVFVKLKKFIVPGSTAQVSTDFSLYIPKISRIRMGNYGNGEFYVAYWYPQISVYDDIDGWDMLQYSGSVEFYNDFNNYEFNITVPGDYVVWSTGELQNAKEVYQASVVKKIEKAKQSDETVRMFDSTAHKNKKVTTPGEKHTWKFKAKDVTDISFCTSDSYVWDAASVEVDPATHRRVLCSAVFEEGTAHWDSAAQYARQTIEYMSKELPGYPYPYPHTTSFCNKGRGGGMEIPMMTNDGAPSNLASHIGLVFHEIAHTYFPFFMGTNERKYAWMDEGWASFFPREVVDRNVPEFNYIRRNVGSYSRTAGNEMELPMMVPSYSNKGRFARIAFYSKPATAYNELMELLGRETFKKALHAYMDRWHFKHPLPYDFFYTFNSVSGENLNWFWKAWFFDLGRPDLSISSADKTDKGYSIKIDKVGSVPTRIRVTLKFSDGTDQSVEKSARVWEDKYSTTINIETDKTVSEVVLGGSDIPDSDKSNNSYTIN